MKLASDLCKTILLTESLCRFALKVDLHCIIQHFLYSADPLLGKRQKS